MGNFCPPGSGSGCAIWMRIRILQLKLMRIHADPDPDTDPDPKPCVSVWPDDFFWEILCYFPISISTSYLTIPTHVYAHLWPNFLRLQLPNTSFKGSDQWKMRGFGKLASVWSWFLTVAFDVCLLFNVAVVFSSHYFHFMIVKPK